jgi:hypothetical protein
MTKTQVEVITSGGCGCGVVWFPIPRRKLADPPGRMIGQSAEHVGEPGARINMSTAGLRTLQPDSLHVVHRKTARDHFGFVRWH